MLETRRINPEHPILSIIPEILFSNLVAKSGQLLHHIWPLWLAVTSVHAVLMAQCFQANALKPSQTCWHQWTCDNSGRTCLWEMTAWKPLIKQHLFVKTTHKKKKNHQKSQSIITIKLNSAFGFRGRLLWLYSFNSFWLLVPLEAGEAGSFSASSRQPRPQQCSGGCGIWPAVTKRDIRFSRNPSCQY